MNVNIDSEFKNVVSKANILGKVQARGIIYSILILERCLKT
jgi:hypothetical protein